MALKKFYTLNEKQLIPFTEKQLEDEVDYENLIVVDRDFSSIKTKSLSFTKTIFRNVNFTGAIMQRIQVYDSRFEMCSFANTNLSGSAIQRTEFFQCRVTGLNMNGALIKNVLFKECKGEYSQFRQMQCKGIEFKDCQLSFADFVETSMPEAVFTGSDINNSDFTNAYLKESDLRTSTIDGIRIGIKELQDVIVDPTQALYLAGLLGIKIM